MDYINLLTTMLAYNTTYNLVLEDDVKPAKHALHKAYEFAVMLENQTDWAFLTFYNVIRGKSFVSNARKTWLTGACAWLYRKKVAEGCLKMLRADPQRWPVDLLVPQYVFDTLDLQTYERTPNLFQHISAVSTYTGQVSNTHYFAVTSFCMCMLRILINECMLCKLPILTAYLCVSWQYLRCFAVLHKKWHLVVRYVVL